VFVLLDPQSFINNKSNLKIKIEYSIDQDIHASNESIISIPKLSPTKKTNSDNRFTIQEAEQPFLSNYERFCYLS
jgi:hypothetical protein